jgi:1,4-alpha-glucan branching enzyme
MATIPVRFTFVTGIKPPLFSNARLHGSWDANGRYSDHWSVQPMGEPIPGEDGCPAFSTIVNLDSTQTGSWFHWGVSLDTPDGAARWAIMTETNDHLSQTRYRSFQLQPAGGDRPQHVRYYLNESRRLGAQHYYKDGQNDPGIRFSVWAPNVRSADAIEVVMGSIWDGSDARRQPASDPAETPATRPLTRQQVCGGYIADDGSGAHPGWGPFAMVKQADGIWVSDIDDSQLASFAKFDHSPYMFRITKNDGSTAYRTDLFSRCQIGYGNDNPVGEYIGKTLDLAGTVSCSVVVDPDQVTQHFTEPVWPETQWLTQDAFWNDPAYTPRRSVPTRFGKADSEPGTLQEAIDFLDHLEELGVNAVELLPMSEFGGASGGWGYATSHYFAIEYSGGGRDNYKWFVRECHRRGIAVILDVVYNHYNHNAERAEWMYDTNSHDKNMYYWYEGTPSDYPDFDNAVAPERRGTGGYLDNLSTAWAPRYYEERIRKMFVSSAVALALEFHIDGFRMDQTTSIHAYNALHANGRAVGTANLFGQKLLRELTRTLKFVKPTIMLMAEDHSNWDMVTEPSDGGPGLGFDATWHADFYHHLIGDTDKGSDYAKLIKTAGLGDNRPLAMSDFAGVLEASGSKKVVYHESHDEAGNGNLTHRTIKVAVNSAPLTGETRRYAEARCRFAAGVSMLSAGTPMFLFGEEVGADKDFLYGQVLENREDLLGLRHDSGGNLFEFYRQLIRLRLDHAGLKSRNIKVVHTHNEHRLLVFRRWTDQDTYLVVASLNNSAFNQPGYRIDSAEIPDGSWREIFNSDAAAYDGENIGNGGGVLTSRFGSLECVIPANGFVVFERA